MKKEIFEKIVLKKEFSKLPKKDVEVAFSHFSKRQVSDAEKIRLTRELLHKVFSSFVSQKLLSLKNKDEEWILRKHLSTRERLDFYEEVYSRIFKEIPTKGIIDLGCGINGFSYKFVPKEINYLGVESVGQLVDLQNDYFSRKKIKGKVYHYSLFDLKEIKKLIKGVKGNSVLFLFKVLDCLEMLERDYSKKLLLEVGCLVDRVVVSFATKSMIKKQRFNVSRKWILDFIEENFNILDDFEIGNERYIVFECK
jgi:hypothetical protein